MEPGGIGVLDLQQLVEPLLLFRPGGGVRHGGRLGAGAGGIDEGKEGVKTHLLHQGHGVHGLRLRLTGEADDDVAGQHQTGHHLFGIVDLRQVLFPGVAAVHLVQYAVIAGLEGKVELLCHMGAFGHHVKEVVGGVLGMAGHEADQVLAGDLVDVL